MNNGMEKEIFEIYLEDIIPNRFQPRLAFDEKALSELAESIKAHGIIQPLVLRKVGDKYEIIAGERRFKAASIAGLTKVPAVVMNLDDNESAELAVIENIQRQDLNAIEEAESYKKLLDRNYLTQEQLASRMGKTQATISNKLRLLSLDNEVRDALLNGKISERHARSLLSLKTPEEQKNILNQILNNKLTVRQTDDLVKSITGVAPTISSDDDTSSDSTVKIPQANPQEVVPMQSISEMNKPVSQIDTTPILDFGPAPAASQSIEQSTPTPSIGINPQPVDLNSNINVDQASALEIKPQPVNSMGVNVDKIKEEAFDINPPKETPDLDRLMSVTENGQSKEVDPNSTLNAPTQPLPDATAQNRFIPSFEEEQTNMNVDDLVAPIQKPSVEMPQPISIPSSIGEISGEPKIMPSIGMGSQPIEPIIPPQPQPPINQTSTINMGIPSSQSMNQPIGAFGIGQSQSQPPVNDLKSAIGTVRDMVRELEKRGFGVDMEEFDFEHLYQMIIKINK